MSEDGKRFVQDFKELVSTGHESRAAWMDPATYVKEELEEEKPDLEALAEVMEEYKEIISFLENVGSWLYGQFTSSYEKSKNAIAEKLGEEVLENLLNK